MPLIRANRDAVDDRFSVLGFTIRSETPLFEVGIATDPELFKVENKTKRSRRNFYSSRGVGALRAARGEAVYLVPSDVMGNFAGAARIYFGLATYAENSRATPVNVQTPSTGSLYVSAANLTERGLRRLITRPSASSYGGTKGADASLDWGGDAITYSKAANGAKPATAAAPAPAPAASAPVAAAQAYDDGYGAMPARPLEMEDADQFGIEGPIPDQQSPVQAQSVRALEAPVPDFPGASRFVPAHASNYTAGRKKGVVVDRVVIHTTDGAGRTQGTINYFQNPEQRNQNNQNPHASSHYIVGRDGEVVQVVRNSDTAHHASGANWRSIGIEHETSSRPRLEPTEAEYAGSAWLVAWLCAQYRLPIDRDHIVGHHEISPRDNHDCPAQGWNWDHYMDCVRTAAAAIAVGNDIASGVAAAVRAVLAPVTAQGLGYGRPALARAQEIITPFYDPADPSSALQCQDNAFSLAREEWFMGVPNTRIFPHSAICHLRMTDTAGKTFTGTGFYIGTNRILTCAHNLYQMVSVTITPGRDGENDSPFGQCTVSSSSWRIAPSYTGSGNWDNDLAVIDNLSLAAPNGNYFGFLNATPSTRMPVVVCGYAARSVTVPGLTQAIDRNKQHLHGGYVASQSNPEVIEYPLLTLKGNSGSPVYHLDDSSGSLQALVTAVHVTGEPAASGLNRGCFITPTKIDWIEGRATTFSLKSGSRALEIPLDPGAGGQSIGLDALSAGDIIVSTARHPVSYAIRGGTVSAISHAMVYVGGGNVVEAVGNGVRETGLATAIDDAILAVAYRDPRVDAAKAAAIVAYARAQVGLPYNYAAVVFTGYRQFNPIGAKVADWAVDKLGLGASTATSFYCSELVFAAYASAGLPLSAARADASLPEDVVQLSHGLLGYVGHLKAQDVFLGIQLSADAVMPMRRSRTLGNEAFSIYWDVPYYPQQKQASCWAASAAMVVGWRDQVCITDAEISAKVPAIDMLKNGIFPSQRKQLADVWNLYAEPPASYTIQGWRQMLENNGPLYIDMRWAPHSGGHVRVLVGMESDGNADGSGTTMLMNDPWPGTAGQIKLSFAQFLTLYEQRTENSGGIYEYQILHAGGSTLGKAPLTAAPFSVDASVALQRDAATGKRRAAIAQAASDLDYPVTLIPQPDKNACWAASMAMLVGYRRNQSVDPELMVERVGGSLRTSYDWNLLTQVRKVGGFEVIAQPSNASLYMTPQQWHDWLESYGPLWVVIVGAPHAVVLAGIKGDLADKDTVTVKVLNPWDTRVSFDSDAVDFHPANGGYESWMKFNDFASEFGNMAEPNYGNWRVLHLPTTAAMASSLAVVTTPGRRSLLAPPPPRRVQAMAMEPASIVGTTITTVRGSQGTVSWALEQLKGMKQPSPAPMAVLPATDNSVQLADWPRMGSDSNPLPLTVTFASAGGAVGDVRITAGTPAAVPYTVVVSARINDEPPCLDNPPLAALGVVIDYRFTGTAEGDHCGTIKLRLLGNGRHDMECVWA